MANARMYLCCTLCLAKPETTLEQCQIYLGKYYPSTGWMVGPDKEKLEKWLDEHNHHTLTGKHFAVTFDSWFSDAAKSRDEILQRVSDGINTLSEKGEES